MKLKIVGLYKGDFCAMQLEVKSDNYRMVRRFDEFYVNAIRMPEQIRQFNDGRLKEFDITSVYLNVDLKNIEGSRWGHGEINDYLWPESNKLSFEGRVVIEWEHTDYKELPPITV